MSTNPSLFQCLYFSNGCVAQVVGIRRALPQNITERHADLPNKRNLTTLQTPFTLNLREPLHVMGIGPKPTWSIWFRTHAKAIFQSLPVAFLIVSEARDMYHRATWVVTPVPPSNFETGDVIFVCNRWYTLPTWSHKIYSLLSKVLLKCAWDEVGFIVAQGKSEPHLVYCDFFGVHNEPLASFLNSRLPRGAALRKLHLGEGVQLPGTDIATAFIKQITMNEPHPWYLFSASFRRGREQMYYEICTTLNKQRRKLNDMIRSSHSGQAISKQVEQIRDMEATQDLLGNSIQKQCNFRLFNGSLVASFLATCGLLNQVLPSPSRYVPQDFANDLPFTGTTSLEEPIVFFKS